MTELQRAADAVLDAFPNLQRGTPRANAILDLVDAAARLPAPDDADRPSCVNCLATVDEIDAETGFCRACYDRAAESAAPDDADPEGLRELAMEIAKSWTIIDEDALHAALEATTGDFAGLPVVDTRRWVADIAEQYREHFGYPVHVERTAPLDVEALAAAMNKALPVMTRTWLESAELVAREYAAALSTPESSVRPSWGEDVYETECRCGALGYEVHAADCESSGYPVICRACGGDGKCPACRGYGEVAPESALRGAADKLGEAMG